MEIREKTFTTSPNKTIVIQQMLTSRKISNLEWFVTIESRDDHPHGPKSA